MKKFSRKKALLKLQNQDIITNKTSSPTRFHYQRQNKINNMKMHIAETILSIRPRSLTGNQSLFPSKELIDQIEFNGRNSQKCISLHIRLCVFKRKEVTYSKGFLKCESKAMISFFKEVEELYTVAVMGWSGGAHVLATSNVIL